MALSKFVFRPGIFREGTSYDNEGGWFDCNLIRFNAGRPEKIGGWRKDVSESFLGTCRDLHSWVLLDGTKFLGLGTNLKYYVEKGNTYFDVTPIRRTTSAGMVTFSATDGDATITVTDTSNGSVQNDFVTFSGAVSLGGNITAAVLNQEYQVATIVNDNTYTIEAKDTSGNTVTANSSDTGNGGSSVVGTYQLNVGLDVYVPSTGFGVGSWGYNAYGSTSSLSFTNQLRLWSHDNFGEDLIINPRNGGIFYWDSSAGTSTRAVDLKDRTGANLVPNIGLQTLVSEKDRHVIVLGADPINDAGTARTGTSDPMLIAFSDQENELDFEPTNANTAGSLRLSEGSVIIGAVKARQEILIWTDTSMFSMQFIGPPFTFGVSLINKGVGLIAPNAAITGPNAVYWMGYDSFYSYNGSVAKIPCPVLTYVFEDMNNDQQFKTIAFTNNEFNEVGWFYCSSSSTEIDRYVVYNYLEQAWSYGNLSRTYWLDRGTKNYPRAVSNNYLYEHEFGYNDDGSPMTGVFIESSDFDVGDGEQFAFINRIVPDVRFLNNSAAGKVNMVLKTRNFPGESLSTSSTNQVGSDTTQVFTRARARQGVLRLESDDDASGTGNNDTGWRLGATRLDVRTDGRR